MNLESQSRQRPVWLRIRALLAGALVLGVGAAATLASWNDSESATGSFGTSVFDTESSVEGSAYADNNEAPGPTVSVGGAGFAPGVSKYFPVLIRTKASSAAVSCSANGASLTGADALTLGPAFVYRVVRTTGTCDPTAFTGLPVFVVGGAATSRPLIQGQEADISNSLEAAAATAPGAATGFCFQVTLPANADNSLQGKTVMVTRQFVATSS